MPNRSRATAELKLPVAELNKVCDRELLVECEPGNGSAECHVQHLTHEERLDACEAEIRELAYLKWEAAGRPCCDGFDFWIEAEQEVMNRL